jgi:predicted nucleic acid-binding protein
VSLVVDASVLVRLLLQSGQRGAAVQGSIDEEDLHAPHLIDLEVTSALRRLRADGAISAGQSDRAVRALPHAPVLRYPHGPLVTRIWDLRANLTAYDAAYVALAEVLACPLLTSDEGLATAPGPRCPRRHLP